MRSSWERVGQDFNPEVGFLSRTSYQLFSTEWQFNPRPKFLPWVRQLEIKPIELSYYIDDITREMQSVYMEFRPLGLFLKSGDEEEILFNFRVTWIPKPGANLYFVLSQFGDTLNPHRRIQMNKTVAMLKFIWYFSTK